MWLYCQLYNGLVVCMFVRIIEQTSPLRELEVDLRIGRPGRFV